MDALQIHEEQNGGVVVLRVVGFLDAHTAPQFEKTLARAVERGLCRIVVDCGGLSYISSTGLGVFMAFVDSVRDAGGDIKLAAVGPKVYKVFDLLGFPKLFEFHPSVEDALPGFAAGT
jgi:anti-sigma B factor antagonist